jgi:hypothetical protein
MCAVSFSVAIATHLLSVTQMAQHQLQAACNNKALVCRRLAAVGRTKAANVSDKAGVFVHSAAFPSLGNLAT